MSVYLARQPILDRNRATFGYELLYRSSTLNHCDEADRHCASLELLNDGLFLHGVRELIDDNVLFINFEPRTVLEGFTSILPAAQTVLEIPAGASASNELIAAMREAQAAGFR